MHARMTLHWNIAHNTIPCVSPLITYHTYTISPPHRTNPLPEAHPTVSLQTARQIRVLSCTCPFLPAFPIIRDVILFTIINLSNTPKRFAMFLKAEMHNTSIVKSRRALAALAQMGEKLRRPPEPTQCASLQSSIMCICTGAVFAVQGREIAEKLR